MGRAVPVSAPWAPNPPGPPVPNWSETERRLVESVEPALDRALTLKRHWDDTRGRNAQQFQLVRAYSRPDLGYSFFDQVPLEGRPYPVMGDLQDLFYDRPKGRAPNPVNAEWMRRQVQGFVLRYFLRILQTRRPESFPDAPRSLPAALRPFSWCPQKGLQLQGFGFRQLIYKLRGSGQLGRFWGAERNRIIPLRQLIDRYEWVVVKIRIFDFDLNFSPLGEDLPSLDVPLRETQYAVLHRDFLVDVENSSPGVIGEYGIGYALLPSPKPGSLLAYGPGHFESGFQLIYFRVLDTGEVRVRLKFMVNRPKRLLNLSLDPLGWATGLNDVLPRNPLTQALEPLATLAKLLPGRGLNVAPLETALRWLNVLTAGASARDLCLSMEQLEKDMLVKHFQQTFDTVEITLFTWRQVADWLNPQQIPRWIRTGNTALGLSGDG